MSSMSWKMRKHERSKRGGGEHSSCKQFGNKVTFEQRSAGSKGVSHAVMWGKRKLQVHALRQEHACCIPEDSLKPVGLEHREQGGER